MKPLLYLFPGLMCDEALWAAQVSGLEDLAEIVVPDFRGFDSLAAMAESAISQAPRRFSVVGHSMGGRVALEAWRIAGAQIDRLALLDTGVAPKAGGEGLKRRCLVELGQRQGMEAVAKAWIPGMVHPDRLSDEPLMYTMTEMLRRCSVDDFERQQTALLERPDASGLLAGISCPTLVACGRQDEWAPPAQHQAMAAGIARANFEVIEGCGHMSPMERPAELTALLRAWLEAS